MRSLASAKSASSVWLGVAVVFFIEVTCGVWVEIGKLDSSGVLVRSGVSVGCKITSLTAGTTVCVEVGIGGVTVRVWKKEDNAVSNTAVFVCP